MPTDATDTPPPPSDAAPSPDPAGQATHPSDPAFIAENATATNPKPRARLVTEIVHLPPDPWEQNEDNFAHGENGEHEHGDGHDSDDSDEERVPAVDPAPTDGQGAPDDDFLAEYPADTDELHLQHLRLENSSLPPLRLPRFTGLRRLCLRQNELESPLPAECLELPALEDLDLYDNRLGPRVEDDEVKGMSKITSLDFSFNNIRHVPNLPSLKAVSILYLVQNKIPRIEEGALDWCADTLTSIELGGNRIRVIENIEKLVHLTELWLGKNKIRKLECLDTFSNLKILSIQSNRITKLEGLEGLVNLEELYLSHNGLKKIEGLEKNLKLRTLDVGNNEIELVEGVSQLSELEEFWASGNKIPDLRSVEKQLRGLKNLETVYLEGNPCQTNDRANYRRKVILALPQVKQIDATFVRM